MLSVITPVLNGAAFIEKNIQSVQALSIPVEHIVVDGGSTDGTTEIVKKYPHIRLLNQSANTGMYGAIDEGIRASSGEYVAWLNADDQYLKGMEEVYTKAKENKADLAYANAYYHYLKEAKTKRFIAPPFPGFWLRQGMFPFCQSSSIFSRKIYDKSGGFRFNEFKVCGDLDLYQNFAYCDNVKILFVPVYASVFLRYPESLGESNIPLYQKEYQKLKCFNAGKFLIRVPYKLLRIYSQLYF